MTTSEKYVTGVYCVVFAVLLVYLLIMALKLQRLEREVSALEPRQPEVSVPEREPVEAGVDG